MKNPSILYGFVAIIWLVNGIIEQKPVYLAFAGVFLLLVFLYWSQNRNK